MAEEDEVNEHASGFEQRMKRLEKNLEEQKQRIDKAWQVVVDTEAKASPLQELVEKLSDNSNTVDVSLEKLLKKMTEVEGKFADVDEFYDNLFVAKEGEEGSKSDGITNHHKEIQTLLETIRNERKEIAEFKQFILGDSSSTGFKKQVEDFFAASRKDHEGLIETHGESFTTLYDKIEGLLPGATSTGLAKAFEEQIHSYRKLFWIWSLTFGLAVGGMIAFGVYFFVETPQLTLTDTLLHIVARLPFFLPAIWLAVFAAKRQNQNMRLLQEYIYKETLAKSYEGHRREIDKLPDSDVKTEMLTKHLATLVQMLSYNPSLTLENVSHSEDPPWTNWIPKFGPNKRRKASVPEDGKPA